VSATTVVRVVSTRPPAIRWPCPRCRSRVFDCSERFRANSNGKLVDIWLIYRCRDCDATKNVTVVERRRVSKVPRDLLRAAEENDPVVARALARRVTIPFAEGDEWEIDRAATSMPLTLVFEESLLVRLDRVVAAALGVPRSRLPIEVDSRLRLHAGPVLVA
jgi:hypothetical protein